jgi:hypothetical protein
MNRRRKGKKFEYRVRDYLRSLGYHAYLMSNSKPWDITAWAPGDKQAILVECKTRYDGPNSVSNFYLGTFKIPARKWVAIRDGNQVEFRQLICGNFIKFDPIDYIEKDYDRDEGRESPRTTRSSHSS